MDNKLIAQLIEVATAKIPHVYNGMCPDAVEGHDVRDTECPACKVLLAAAQPVASGQSEHVTQTAAMDAWLDSVVDPVAEPKTWRQMAAGGSGACIAFARWGFAAGVDSVGRSISDDQIRAIAARYDTSSDAVQRWRFRDVVPMVRAVMQADAGLAASNE